MTRPSTRLKAHFKVLLRGGEVATHQAHNLKIASANLAPATKYRGLDSH